MRHQKNKRKLSRAKDERNALLALLAVSLIKRERIRTTEAKAKELRPFIEKLVTKARRGDQAAHRLVAERLRAKAEARKLLCEIAPRYKERPGGYTRIVKMPKRKADASPMAVIEFVESE